MMIPRHRIEHMRKSASESDFNRVDVDKDSFLYLLDAAESALELAEQVERYKKSIAITDVNFRVMQRERDSLRDAALNLVDALDDVDGRSFMHRDAGLLDCWKALRALVVK